jgi:hypothetical protein
MHYLRRCNLNPKSKAACKYRVKVISYNLVDLDIQNLILGEDIYFCNYTSECTYKNTEVLSEVSLND